MRARVWAWIACRLLGSCDWEHLGPRSWAVRCRVCGWECHL